MFCVRFHTHIERAAASDLSGGGLAIAAAAARGAPRDAAAKDIAVRVEGGRGVDERGAALEAPQPQVALINNHLIIALN